jgi:hypothetical protein
MYKTQIHMSIPRKLLPGVVNLTSLLHICVHDGRGHLRYRHHQSIDIGGFSSSAGRLQTGNSYLPHPPLYASNEITLLDPLFKGTVKVLVRGVDPSVVVGTKATTWVTPLTTTLANL